jgi:secreted trypsin-like serine protease
LIHFYKREVGRGVTRKMYHEDLGAMPNTPLMEEAPTQIGGGRSGSYGVTPYPEDEVRTKKRNKMACIGVLILGGIIAVALIIVGVKEATNQPDFQKLNQQANSIPTTSSPTPAGSDPSTLEGSDPTDAPIQPQITTDSNSDTTTAAVNEETSSTTAASGNTAEVTTAGNTAKVTTTKATTAAAQQSTDNIIIEDGESLLESVDTLLESDQQSIKDLAIDPDIAPVTSIFDDDNPLDETVVQQSLDDIKNEINTMDVNAQPNTELGNIQQELSQFDSPSPRFLGPNPRAASRVVFCDPVRELRCADKSQCYPVAKKCDAVVDCNDYSDENSCTCKDRLIDARLCDGYEDCRLGEDELECTCAQDQFFCDMEPFDKPVCKKKSYVCDAVEDCRNGRDEDGCIVNFPHTLDLTEARPAFSHSSGLLTIRVDEDYKYLAVDEDQHELVGALALRTCDGLIDFEEVSYKVIEYEYDLDKVAIIDSFDQKNGRYRFIGNDGRYKHLHLVHVKCFTKSCSAFSSVEKRAPAHELPAEFADKSAAEIAIALDEGVISVNGTEAKIVGGAESNIKLWPSTIALYRNSKFICGGTLISPSWIITAGHCLYKYEKKDKFFRMRIGMQRKDSQSPWEQNRIITEVYMHPDYEPTFLRHDLSLGKLDRPVLINRYAQPICLPFNAEMTPDPGQTCTAAGWGLVSEKGLPSEELKEVKLHVLDQCWRNYNNISYQICAGAELGQDSCQGDSGGPLYCQSYSGESYLGGVISHGKGCGREGEPGVYVRLSVYYEWIEQVMAGDVARIDEPVTVCPGLMCGTGECAPTDEICDEVVNCLDNGDVRYCQEVGGNRVQVLPVGVQLYDNPDLGHVDDDPFEEKQLDPSDSEEASHSHEEAEHHDDGHGDVDNGDDNTKDEVEEHETTLHTPDISGLPKFFLSTVSCSAEQFKCSKVEQCISVDQKCDGVVDCLDMSDEVGCVCGDILMHMNSSLVNNGIRDCQDGSDERESLCKENEFRCPGTSQCLSKMQKCDTKSDCPGGEDEENCAILVSDKQVLLAANGAIVKSSSGYLVIFSSGNWKPICVPVFTNRLTKNLCNFMGFSDGSFQLVPKDQSPLNTAGGSGGCNHVYLTCGLPRCGDPVALRQRGIDTTQVSRGEGVHPWTVALLADGEYVCSASLIHPKYILTSWFCGVSMLRKRGYNTVVAGQDVLNPVGWSPYSQIRRLGKFKSIQGTKVLLANLESPFELTSFVRHLCRGAEDFQPKNLCHISGKSGTILLDGYPVEVAGTCGQSKTELCSCENEDVDSDSCKLNIQTEAKDTSSWGGALACPDNSGAYFYVGLNTDTEATRPTEFYNLVTSAMFEKIPGLLTVFESESFVFPTDACFHRCSKGNCLTEGQVCDGTWDCLDGSDEAECSASLGLPTCTKIQGTDLCTCPQDYGKCDNNVCIPASSYCDGINDCGDNSDEKGDCKNCLKRIRFSNPAQICDGVSDCADGEDEDPALCGCSDDHFLCKDLSKDPNDYPYCQPRTNLCDGRKHCYSGIDEEPNVCINLGSKADLNSTDLAPATNSIGYLQIRMKGKWYVYCTPEADWADPMGVALCSELGFAKMYVSLKKTPDYPVVDIGYLETGILSPSCKTIYIVCGM